MNFIDDDVDTPRVLSIPVSSSLLIHPYRLSFSLFLVRSAVVVHAIRWTTLGVSVSCAPLISRTIVVPRFRTTTMMRTPWVRRRRRIYICEGFVRSVCSLFLERSIFPFFTLYLTIYDEFNYINEAVFLSFLSVRSPSLGPLRSTRSGRGRRRSIFSTRAVNFRSPDQTIRTK